MHKYSNTYIQELINYCKWYIFLPKTNVQAVNPPFLLLHGMRVSPCMPKIHMKDVNNIYIFFLKERKRELGRGLKWSHFPCCQA